MVAYLIRRLLWSLLALWVVMTLVFVLIFALGDPASATLGPKAHREQLQAFRQRHGLDRPLWTQYLGYLGLRPCVRPSSPAYPHQQACGLLQGELGESFRENEAVWQVIAVRLPRTLLLGILASLIELFLGVLIGVAAALRRGGWFDTLVMVATFAGMSVPSFIIALFALDGLAFRLGWFPVGGYGLDFGDHLYHALLPSTVLAVLGAAIYARIMRSEMLETLAQDFLRTARAKGAGRARRIVIHGLRNSLIPVVTLLGLQLSSLVSGAIITETIFAWPGVGRLAVESIYNLDAPVIMGVVLIAAVAVQLGNFLADLVVAWLDPRIRLA